MKIHVVLPLVSADSMSLSDIANAISAQTGIPVRLAALTAGGTTGGTAGGVARPAAPQNGQPALSSQEMPVSYEGPLSGLLERLSAYFSVSWHFDGSSITISRYETRIFVVEALPGTQQINEGMQDDVSSSSGSSSSGASGTSAGSTSSSQNTLTQNSKTTMDLKYWDELTAVLKAVVGNEGTSVVSPTMGTVTVTTTPDIMATVSDYLSKENNRLSRQIAINVQIYSVNIGQSEDFNLAFSAFLTNLTQHHLPGLQYNSAAAPGITNTAIASGSLGSLSVAILNGQGSNASDVFNALSTVGDTTEVAQFPMTTLNNHPVSRRVGTDTSLYFYRDPKHDDVDVPRKQLTRRQHLPSMMASHSS